MVLLPLVWGSVALLLFTAGRDESDVVGDDDEGDVVVVGVGVCTCVFSCVGVGAGGGVCVVGDAICVMVGDGDEIGVDIDVLVSGVVDVLCGAVLFLFDLFLVGAD